MPVLQTKIAGRGEHHCYVLRSPSAEKVSIKKNESYISLKGCSWQVNRANSWLKSKDITATLSLQTGNAENLSFCPGLYTRKGKDTIVPMPFYELLPYTKYEGGTIKLRAQFSGIKKDLRVNTLIQSAATSSRHIAQAFSQYNLANSESTQGLCSAGEEIVGGIQDVIQLENDISSQIFAPFNGPFLELDLEVYQESELYVLFHRGSELDPSMLKITHRNDTEIPLFNNLPLTDGAWILIKLTSLSAFPKRRPWQTELDTFQFYIEDLVKKALKLKMLGSTDLFKQNIPESYCSTSLQDNYVYVRNKISQDTALNLSERALFLTTLQILFEHVKEVIGSGSEISYKLKNQTTLSELSTGHLSAETLGALEHNYISLSESRLEYSFEGEEDFLISILKKDFKKEFSMDRIKYRKRALKILEPIGP